MVKTLPAYAGDTSSILGQEDPLEKEMATHYSILAWRIPWTEGPARLQSMGTMGSPARHDLLTKQQPPSYVPCSRRTDCFECLEALLHNQFSMDLF